MIHLFKRMMILICLGIPFLVWAEEDSLQYFMRKVNNKTFQLNPKERSELFQQIENLLGRMVEVHQKLVHGIQSGEIELRYQEGRFWLSQLEKDQEWMKRAQEQLAWLKNHSTHLVSAMELYRSLKNLSFHFNAYNNQPLFSASIGDLGPEIELWADPIFYQLFLLPLARSKEKGVESFPKTGKPAPKQKSP